MRAHGDDELAHYSSACFDVEYEFDFGWSELEGIADRGTYDLDQHAEHSGKKLSYFDQPNNEHFTPAVVETSAGVDRAILTVLADAYNEEEVNGEKRNNDLPQYCDACFTRQYPIDLVDKNLEY